MELFDRDPYEIALEREKKNIKSRLTTSIIFLLFNILIIILYILLSIHEYGNESNGRFLVNGLILGLNLMCAISQAVNIYHAKIDMNDYKKRKKELNEKRSSNK